MSDNTFFSVKKIDEILFVVSGVLKIYEELKVEMEGLVDSLDRIQSLSIRFWSLSSTLSECIFQISEHLRESTTRYNMRHSLVINQQYNSAKEAEQKSKNDGEYIQLRYGDAQQLQNYLDYLNNVKSDADRGHYMLKEFYQKQTDIYLMTHGIK